MSPGQEFITRESGLWVGRGSGVALIRLCIHGRLMEWYPNAVECLFSGCKRVYSVYRHAGSTSQTKALLYSAL